MSDQPYEPESDDDPAPDITDVEVAPPPVEVEDSGEDDF
jgi:hypothetical protein